MVATDGQIGVVAGALGGGVGTNAASATNFMDDEITGVSTTGKTIVRTGTKFMLKAKPQSNTTQVVKALLTILGNETGGFKTIVITVDPSGFMTQDIQSALVI